MSTMSIRMKMGKGAGASPVLGMIVDRSSFDETEDYFLAEDDAFTVKGLQSPSCDSLDAGPEAVVMKNGKVRRRLRWKPRALRSNRASSNVSVLSMGEASYTDKSCHTFSSSETPVQSNTKKESAMSKNLVANRVDHARPQYRGNYDGVATINSEAGFVHSRMNETKAESNKQKQKLSFGSRYGGSKKKEKPRFDPYGAPPLPPRVGRQKSNQKMQQQQQYQSEVMNPPNVISPISMTSQVSTTPLPNTLLSNTSSSNDFAPVAPARSNFDAAQRDSSPRRVHVIPQGGSESGNPFIELQRKNHSEISYQYNNHNPTSTSLESLSLNESSNFEITTLLGAPKQQQHLVPLPIVSPSRQHRSEPVAMAQPSLFSKNHHSNPVGMEMEQENEYKRIVSGKPVHNISSRAPQRKPSEESLEKTIPAAESINRVISLTLESPLRKSVNFFEEQKLIGKKVLINGGAGSKLVGVDNNLQAIQAMAAEHLAHREYDEALEVFVEILRGQLERHGPAHHRVGTALHNIGIVHLKKRNYEKVIQVGEQAVRVRKAALGPNHPDVAVSIAQMGLAYLESKRCREALKAFQRALSIRRISLGSKHPKVAKVLNNIGCTLSQLGRLDSALLSFEESLGIQRVALRSPLGIEASKLSKSSFNQLLLSSASSLCNIGSIKLRQGRFDEANLDLEEALLIQQSVLGDRHATVQGTLNNIGMVEKISGNKLLSSDQDLHLNFVTAPTFETMSLNDSQSLDKAFSSDSLVKEKEGRGCTSRSRGWYQFMEGFLDGACGPMQDCKEAEDISLY